MLRTPFQYIELRGSNSLLREVISKIYSIVVSSRSIFARRTVAYMESPPTTMETLQDMVTAVTDGEPVLDVFARIAAQTGV